MSLKITKDTLVSVSFEIDTFDITVVQGANGLITGPSSVNYDADAVFTIAPSVGYHIVDVVVDGISNGAVTSYTIGNVQATHSISAIFEIDVFKITASAGANGRISPTESICVNYGSDQVFTITPEVHFRVVDVLVDGCSVGAVSTYTFSNVVAHHSINAIFAVETFVISASAGVGGSISPSGSLSLDCGADQVIVITPDAHYHVVDVLVDGSSVGAVISHAFNNITAPHTINVTFAIDTFTLTASATAGGSISPSGFVSVDFGANQSFTISANTGYHIVAVVVDSVSQGAGAFSARSTSLQVDFPNIHEAHMITAIFAIDVFVISASAGVGGSISPSGSVSVNYGANPHFTITANAGYHIVDVQVDGNSQGSVSPQTTSIQADFANVHDAHTITAIFAINNDTSSKTE